MTSMGRHATTPVRSQIHARRRRRSNSRSAGGSSADTTASTGVSMSRIVLLTGGLCAADRAGDRAARSLLRDRETEGAPDSGGSCARRLGLLRSPSNRRRRPSAHDQRRSVAAMVLAEEWHVGQVFLSMLWFFLFFIWIWLLITVFADIFRSPDLSGWGKALWSIFIIFLPYLGVFVYLIARGHKMSDRAAKAAADQEAHFRRYVQDVASTSGSGADELAKLADLRDKGVISEEEFQQAKAKALA